MHPLVLDETTPLFKPWFCFTGSDTYRGSGRQFPREVKTRVGPQTRVRVLWDSEVLACTQTGNALRIHVSCKNKIMVLFQQSVGAWFYQNTCPCLQGL